MIKTLGFEREALFSIRGVFLLLSFCFFTIASRSVYSMCADVFVKISNSESIRNSSVIADKEILDFEDHKIEEAMLESWRNDLDRALSEFEKKSNQNELSLNVGRHQTFFQNLVEKRQNLPLEVELLRKSIEKYVSHLSFDENASFEEKLSFVKENTITELALPESAIYMLGFSPGNIPGNFKEFFDQFESASSLDEQIVLQAQLLVWLRGKDFSSLAEVRRQIKKIDLEEMRLSMETNEILREFFAKELSSLPHPVVKRVLELAKKRFLMHLSSLSTSSLASKAPQSKPLIDVALVEHALKLHFGNFHQASKEVLGLSKISQEQFDHLVGTFLNKNGLAKNAFLSQIEIKMRELLGGDYDVSNLLKTSPYLIQEGLMRSLISKRVKLHEKKVLSISTSSDGAKVVTTSEDGSVKILDLESENHKVIQHGAGNVISASVSSDGTKVVITTDDGGVKILDLVAENHKAIQNGAGNVISASVSSDGTKVMIVDEWGSSVVFDLQKKEEDFWYLLEAEPIFSASVSTDLLKLVTVSQRGAWLTNLETKEKREIRHDAGVTYAAISPDGTMVVSISDDGSVKVLNLVTEKVETIHHAGGRVTSAAISSSGRRVGVLIANESGELFLYDLKGENQDK